MGNDDGEAIVGVDDDDDKEANDDVAGGGVGMTDVEVVSFVVRNNDDREADGE